MAKRKAGVNDIIYELDNEDIEISSEDEVKKSKICSLDSDSSSQSDIIIEETSINVVNLDSSSEEVAQTEPTTNLQNGGKIVDCISIVHEPSNSKKAVQNELDTKKCVDHAKTTILNEDIVVDSPLSNNCVNDCSNRTPLVTVRFRDNKVASNYKKQIKAFMLNLIKIHDEENSVESDNETDLELDIWPDDFQEETVDMVRETTDDNLFFVDTDPNVAMDNDIPSYSQTSILISNSPVKESTPPSTNWKPTCFNCDGDHSLRDCLLPKNNTKIAMNRKNMQKVGRYHIEDDQKYGHLIPGRISGQLRHALGLKRHEIPMHIYRMRLLGYPPGWLEEARISHSGITMFDSTGSKILDPEEEEGEVCEPGSKDKFDIKKLLDFPGFNVPVSSRYKEEAHLYSLPPMSEQDSKMAMLQTLAPNAMKAYKRKKLTFFPSTTSKSSQDCQAEMDLDSGNEEAVFPSVPPLPDEAPPPLPPPPPLESYSEIYTPSMPPDSPETLNNKPELLSTSKSPPPMTFTPSLPVDSPQTVDNRPEERPTSEESPCTQNKNGKHNENDDLEVVNIMHVKDIPMPVEDVITIDVDEKHVSSGPESPSLDDLETKKLLLLSALNYETKSISIVDSDDEIPDINSIHNISDNRDKTREKCIETDKQTTIIEDNLSKNNEQGVTNDRRIIKNVSQINNDLETSKISEIKTPGQVKNTHYGTPVINASSPYVNLPTDEKFAKDISELINYENLPNSVGAYKKMSTLLKKVKSEVDRIQDS